VALTQADIDAIWSKDINASPTVSNLAYTTVFSIFQTVNALASTVAAQQTLLATMEARLVIMQQIIEKLDLDPADEPPQLNPIVIGTRHPIANP
jgi:hypothetical protein